MSTTPTKPNTGNVDMTRVTCPTCGGRGDMRDPDPYAESRQLVTCTGCGGKGYRDAVTVTQTELLPALPAEAESGEAVGCSALLAGPSWRSVYDTNDEILNAIMHLHCPDGFECDMTFGNGSFWKRLPRPRLCYDITPLHEGVVQADSRMLPLPPASLNNCVFDPPFLTYVRGGREHNSKVAMTSRFGGYYRYDELEDHYRDTISEAYRVLKPRGKMVFKCQDIIHNHRMHCTHVRVIQMAEIEGFRLADLFVLPARHRMPGPQKGQQRHARIWHSYFLVLERDAARPANKE